MSDRKTANDARKYLRIKDDKHVLKPPNQGTGIDKTIGNGMGGMLPSSYADENSPEGDGSDTGGENEDLKRPLQPGDEPEKFELKDCETNEVVTVDGLGGKGSEPKPPTGFENCQPPPVDPDFEAGFYWEASGYIVPIGQTPTPSYSWHQTSGPARIAALAFGGGMPPQSAIAPHELVQKFVSGIVNGVTGGYDNKAFSMSIQRISCAVTPNDVCDLPPPTPQWPPEDRNHLEWDKELGCIAPLCKENNPHVSPKFQDCKDEYILCDKDGNKVHVKVNADGTMDVTQEKFGQVATIKDGKVQSSKKLTETQLGRLFK